MAVDVAVAAVAGMAVVIGTGLAGMVLRGDAIITDAIITE
jgi:hypothetical protein